MAKGPQFQAHFQRGGAGKTQVTPLDNEIFAARFILCPWICSNVSWLVYGNLNGICILLLCENCVNLNYVELVPSPLQVYCILLRLCIFILLTLESLILKL